MGKDKTGIVDTLAKAVYQHGGNWQGSSFAHMAGMFTGFVEVQVPQNQHDELVAALNGLPDLEVKAVSSPDSSKALGNTLTVEVMGNDKPGIVQELTATLNQFNLNIVSFDSTVESAANWGSMMFKARARLAVPEAFNQDALQSALENLANDLVVDINTQS